MAVYEHKPGGYRDLGLVRECIKVNSEIHRMMTLQLDEHPTPRSRQLIAAAMLLLNHQFDWFQRMLYDPALGAAEPQRVNRLLGQISLLLLNARPTPRAMVFLNGTAIEIRKQADALSDLYRLRG